MLIFSHFKLKCPLFIQWVWCVNYLMSICQGSQIKVILGIYTGWYIDVKLQQLQHLTLKFIPVEEDKRSRIMKRIHAANSMPLA